MATVFLGSDLKLSVTIDPVDSIKATEFTDLKISVYCSPNKIIQYDKKVPNSGIIEIDDDTYVLLVDTNKLGVGDIKIKVEASIPDSDFIETNKRREIAVLDTGITIIKTI